MHLGYRSFEFSRCKGRFPAPRRSMCAVGQSSRVSFHLYRSWCRQFLVSFCCLFLSRWVLILFYLLCRFIVFDTAFPVSTTSLTSSFSFELAPGIPRSGFALISSLFSMSSEVERIFKWVSPKLEIASSFLVKPSLLQVHV